jgi:hypothetical protein
MPAFGPRPPAFATLTLAAFLCGWAIAQPAEQPPGTGAAEGQSLGQLRAELERARDEVFRRFNESNRGRAADVTCNDEQPTGSRMRQTVCRSAAENAADAGAAQDFLGSLLRGAGSSLGGAGANIGTGSAQAEATAGEAASLGGFEQKWVRLLRDDPEFYRNTSSATTSHASPARSASPRAPPGRRARSRSSRGYETTAARPRPSSSSRRGSATTPRTTPSMRIIRSATTSSS